MLKLKTVFSWLSQHFFNKALNLTIYLSFYLRDEPVRDSALSDICAACGADCAGVGSAVAAGPDEVVVQGQALLFKLTHGV